MSEANDVGTVGWFDLTVPDAPALRDFYSAVVGWTSSKVRMGDYADYKMHPSSEAAPIAGICHARGENAGLPPVWLMYIRVADLDASVAVCIAYGGQILVPPRSMGAYGWVAVIQDPAGAVVGLIGPFAA